MDIRAQIEALGGQRQTIESLSASTGLSLGAVSRRLRGDRQHAAGEDMGDGVMWSVEEVVAAARAAGANPAQLLTARGVLRPAELVLAVSEMTVPAKDVAAEARRLAAAVDGGAIPIAALKWIADHPGEEIWKELGFGVNRSGESPE